MTWNLQVMESGIKKVTDVEFASHGIWVFDRNRFHACLSKIARIARAMASKVSTLRSVGY